MRGSDAIDMTGREHWNVLQASTMRSDAGSANDAAVVWELAPRWGDATRPASQDGEIASGDFAWVLGVAIFVVGTLWLCCFATSAHPVDASSEYLDASLRVGAVAKEGEGSGARASPVRPPTPDSPPPYVSVA